MQIQVNGSPRQVCYNWQAAEVVSGSLSSTRGFFNLVRLPLRCTMAINFLPVPAALGKTAPAAASTAGCAEPHQLPRRPARPSLQRPLQECWGAVLLRLRMLPGCACFHCAAWLPVRSRSKGSRPAPQSCCRGAMLMLTPSPLTHLHPPAVGPGGGPAVLCQAPDDRGSPKVCSGGAIASSTTLPTGSAIPSRPPTGVAVSTAGGAGDGN